MDQTPEAKLLELIKKRTASAGRPPWGRTAWVRARALGIRLGGEALERARKIRAGLTPLQIANRGLLAANLVLGVWLVWGWISPSSALKDLERARPLEEAEGSEVAGSRRQGATDLQAVRRRNLFRPLFVTKPAPPPPVVAAPPSPPPPPKIPLSQKAAHLRLVGIINAGTLQAVIEDQKSQKTLYVTEGRSIDDILVEKVLPDRVILLWENERLELSL